MIELTKDDGSNIDRTKLEDLLKQKFFYDMSFSIYGGKCSQFNWFLFYLFVEEGVGIGDRSLVDWFNAYERKWG